MDRGTGRMAWRMAWVGGGGASVVAGGGAFQVDTGPATCSAIGTLWAAIRHAIERARLQHGARDGTLCCSAAHNMTRALSAAICAPTWRTEHGNTMARLRRGTQHGARAATWRTLLQRGAPCCDAVGTPCTARHPRGRRRNASARAPPGVLHQCQVLIRKWRLTVSRARMPQAVAGNYASWDPPLSYVPVAFLNYNLGILSNTGQARRAPPSSPDPPPHPAPHPTLSCPNPPPPPPSPPPFCRVTRVRCRIEAPPVSRACPGCWSRPVGPVGWRG